MYHVAGIGITAILLYLISYSFYRIGYYTLQFHRKLWNTILAAAFTATALAGLFLALQVTYKWNLTFVKTVLKWHVEFGIGMALTGLFHLIWHFSYYTGLFKRQVIQPEEKEIVIPAAALISTNLFIVGFVSTSVQILLLREMMNITGGYELISGTFLGSWLIASAAGSLTAGRSALNNLAKINISFTLSPILSLILLLVLARLFLHTGQSPSFLVSFIYTFLVLIPFCFVSGFTFVKLIGFAQAASQTRPGRSFSIETAGGIVSGIIVSVLTSGFLNTYQLLLSIVILSNAWVLLNFFISRPFAKTLARMIILVMVSFVIIVNTDLLFRQVLLPGVKVTATQDTPYGNITKAEYKGEESIYYNQRLLSYKNDAAEREENIHYAMLQVNKPENVILISGSLSSHLPELLKYHVEKVVYVERDPALAISAGNDSLSENKDIVISNDDGFRFMKRTDEKADAVLLLIPPPSTLLLNRYYTVEFFREVKKKLDDGGVFMCSPGIAETYYNAESIRLYSSVFNSLRSVFKNVLPIAGNKLYFIASDNQVSPFICQLTQMKNISNLYVSPDFLSDDLIRMKSDEIASLMDPSVRLNSSSTPVAYFNFQAFSFSKDIGEKAPSISLLILLFAVPVAAVKRRNLIMYFSASALAGFEILILLSLQLIIGNMYQLTGLIMAGLMAGLAAGAGTNRLFLNDLSLTWKSFILILFYALFGLLFNFLAAVESTFIAGTLLTIAAFIPAMLTGNIFNELTGKKEGMEDSSGIYSSDLAGSALGFILMSGLAIPLAGIRLSVFFLSLIIFTGILFGTVRNKY
jgi:spermidine synthase